MGDGGREGKRESVREGEAGRERRLKTQRKGGIEIQREEETQREDRYPEKVRDKQGQGWGETKVQKEKRMETQETNAQREG